MRCKGKSMGVKITFTLMRTCGVPGVGMSLWAYHDVTGPVYEVATYKGPPHRNLVESCATVYERGFIAGMGLTNKDGQLDTEILTDEESVGEFIEFRLEQKKKDGETEEPSR
jgi:hypothetical protein